MTQEKIYEILVFMKNNNLNFEDQDLVKNLYILIHKDYISNNILSKTIYKFNNLINSKIHNAMSFNIDDLHSVSPESIRDFINSIRIEGRNGDFYIDPPAEEESQNEYDDDYDDPDLLYGDDEDEDDIL
jgi:hypothetical protein